MCFNFISLLFLPLLSVFILSGSNQAFALDTTLLVNTNHRNSTAEEGEFDIPQGPKNRRPGPLRTKRWLGVTAQNACLSA
ncbi:hypothetical protein F2Q70_00020402 [Brassica cretica]|uniref:Secreted protein n=1 Tax=Brassica cretica TaxID=69181 RepID=A0A8S9GST7_BRACR|nr:hypothetical protein F2Q70_00020402 [Brassica cretica]